jgi:hypothetical protein
MLGWAQRMLSVRTPVADAQEVHHAGMHATTAQCRRCLLPAGRQKQLAALIGIACK